MADLASLVYDRAGSSNWQDKILPLRQQADIRDAWLKERLTTILPEIMRREGLDMWLVAAREYNEDPVLMSLLPSTMMSARRRTILVFHAPAEGDFEALAIANAGIGLDGFYQAVWNKSRSAPAQESQLDCLRRVVAERKPKSIGINTAAEFAFGDGLSKHEYDVLMEALGSEFSARCISAERLAVGWLERRTPAEIHASAGINQIAHGLIAEAFSSRVVHPGVSKAADIAWWLRQRSHDLGLSCWFQPTVSVQRQGQVIGDIGMTPDVSILPGDLLHCDFGLHYLGLATDTQQNAYVLRLGEDAPPQGLQDALTIANRQQDLLAATMKAGHSGNEILADALGRMRDAGIRGRIYSHPIGYHGHGAGPLIGLYDQQEGVPGRGDYPLFDDILFSFEMYIEHTVPEWDDQQIKLATEQIVAFTAGRINYLGGRQISLHLIH